jgi:hypothetical protein
MKHCSTLIIQVNIGGEESEMAIEDPDDFLLISEFDNLVREIMPETDVRDCIVEQLLRKAKPMIGNTDFPDFLTIPVIILNEIGETLRNEFYHSINNYIEYLIVKYFLERKHYSELLYQSNNSSENIRWYSK